MLDVELMSGLILFLVGILSLLTFLAIILRRIYLKLPIKNGYFLFLSISNCNYSFLLR